MTKKDKKVRRIRRWLRDREDGFVENKGRRIEIVNMEGGRYMLYDMIRGEIKGLTNNLDVCQEYLLEGNVLLLR